MDIGEMLAQLKCTANSRKKKNLELLYEICREQYERGSKDFSIATIGRLSKKNGGPSTQSIRNRTGDDFKALLSAWANHTGGSIKRQPKVSENKMQTILRKISDVGVRAVMGAVLAENSKLKGQINLLKTKSNIIIDRRKTQFSAINALPTTTNSLADDEKESLQHAFSEENINEQQWSVDESGRVRSKGGHVIFKVGFVTGYKKILDGMYENR